MNWSTWIPWAWYLALLVLMLCGLGVQLMGLPGLWVMAVSALAYAWVTGWQYLGIPGLATIVGLCLVGELIEFLAGAGGAKKAGGSKRAMVGGIIGGIVGGIVLSIPLWIVGTIIGVCIGAFAGATLAQMTVASDVEHSARVGLGAAKGTLIGILSKLTVGCVIFAVAAGVALPTDKPATPPPPAALPAVTQPTTTAAELPETQPSTLPAVERE